MLKLYNLWDLVDSISLSVFVGIPDIHRTNYGKHSSVPTIAPTPHGIDERYSSTPYIFQKPPSATSRPIFAWITSPLTTLWDNGPSGSKEWGKGKDDSKKADYPLGAGRLDPQAVRIVGFMACDADDYYTHFNLEDEMGAIAAGIEWLKPRTEIAGSVWVNDLDASKWIAVLRASLYNAILPTWFLHPSRGTFEDFSRVEVKDFKLRDFAVATGLISDEIDQLLPQIYTGTDEDPFFAQCDGWLSAASSYLDILKPLP